MTATLIGTSLALALSGRLAAEGFPPHVILLILAFLAIS